MKEEQAIDPVVKQILVAGHPAIVFELFASRIDEWWPRSTHSVAGDEVERVVLTGGIGGRVYEVARDGTEHEWGRITEWEPPSLLGMTWYPGLTEAQSTRVEVTFRGTAVGTEVTLVHDGWGARGDGWEQVRENYEGGWVYVLGQVPGAGTVEAAPGQSAVWRH